MPRKDCLPYNVQRAILVFLVPGIGQSITWEEAGGERKLKENRQERYAARWNGSEGNRGLGLVLDAKRDRATIGLPSDIWRGISPTFWSARGRLGYGARGLDSPCDVDGSR